MSLRQPASHSDHVHVEIAFPCNHGIGDELSFAGPLMAALLARPATINVWTFHPELYSHPAVTVRDWRDEPVKEFHPPLCDIGICLASKNSSCLPLEFDRSGLVSGLCKSAGWHMLDADESGHAGDDAWAYRVAARFVAQLGLDTLPPPWPFLHQEKAEHVLLNLVGKGDACKGLPQDDAWVVIDQVAGQLQGIKFVVVWLQDEGHYPPPNKLIGRNNLRISNLPFGSREAKALYCSAKLIVTAEGGGYHMAFGAAIPALLVTPKVWFEQTLPYALPPIKHETVLLEEHSDNGRIAEKISEWIKKIL